LSRNRATAKSTISHGTRLAGDGQHRQGSDQGIESSEGEHREALVEIARAESAHAAHAEQITAAEALRRMPDEDFSRLSSDKEALARWIESQRRSGGDMDGAVNQDMPNEEVERIRSRLVNQIRAMDSAELQIVARSRESLAYFVGEAFQSLAALIGYVIAVPVAWAMRVAESMVEGFQIGWNAAFRHAGYE
jgi:hypothetical protein